MKKIMKLLPFMMALCTVLFIQSCKEDDLKPAPSVSLDVAEGQTNPGGKVTVTATVSAPYNGQTLTVYVQGVETETYDIAGAKDFEQAFEYTVPSNAVVGSIIIISFQAIDKENFPSAIANYKLTVGDPVIVLTGTLTTQTLVAGQPYLLKGQTFVPSGVTLTVPAGTVVKGDKATKATLIIQPGGKLIASGTASNPVIFTSAQAAGERDRGDWGGIVLLGDAWVNQAALPAIEGITPAQTYGNITSPTTNASQNAGTLTYVRIEYAGIELTPNNETNSLTMGGVGNGTTIDHIQASFGGDDGFEWFGGTVNAKYLISLSTWDDDFDTDFGYGGNVQFGLAVRNPFFADQSGSNAFESDNQGNANDTPQGASGYTRGIFSNITVLGPRDITTRALSGNYQHAMHIRRRSALSVFNSVFSGFRLGLRIDDAPTLANLTDGTSKIANNILLVPTTVLAAESSSASDASFITNITANAAGIKTYWDANSNTTIVPTTTWTATDNPYAAVGISASLFWGGQTSANYPSNPDFSVTSGTLASGASFSDAKLTGSTFFEAVAYKGAFGGTDWTDGWAEFQPLNKVQ